MNKIKIFWVWNTGTHVQELEDEVNTFLASLGDKLYDTVLSTTPETSDSYGVITIMVKYNE